MGREQIEAVRTGKMTGIYLSMLRQVGDEGPMLSRNEAEIMILDLCGTVQGLHASLGVRDAYHYDVVCAVFSSIAANTAPLA